VGFKVLAVVRCLRYIEADSFVRIINERFLRFVVRHGDPGRAAILVDTSLANNALDAITVSQSLAQCLEHNTGYAFLLIRARINIGHLRKRLTDVLTPLA
jgi:hypothetical protein